MLHAIAASLALLILTLMTGSAKAEDVDDLPCQPARPCPVEDGDYLLRFPSDWDGRSRLPAVLFFHGYNSSARTTFDSSSLRREFADHGYLVIAPDGARRAPDRPRGWPSMPLGNGVRDDLAFTDHVMADVRRRVPLDDEHILVGGFSSGGSMAWYLACYRGSRYAGFVSIAGGLRNPHPEGACPDGPVRMFHIHGFTDPTVPLEGRRIGPWHQGDVFMSLDLLRHTNGCHSQPDRFEMGETYRCRIWDTCSSGDDIRLCLHDGGHMLPPDWASMARNWFESPTEPPAAN
ncbi:MAG: hypothetical protein R3D03_22950 [Geminicoccaceae bacterium]